MGKTVESFWIALEEENNRWSGFVEHYASRIVKPLTS